MEPIRLKSPVPSENSWTSSIHTMETQPTDFISIARRPSSKHAHTNKAPKPGTIVSNITEIGDFFDNSSQISQRRVTSSGDLNRNHKLPRAQTAPVIAPTQQIREHSIIPSSDPTLLRRASIQQERNSPIAHSTDSTPLQRIPSIISNHSVSTTCRDSEATLIGSPMLSPGEKYWPTENLSHGHRIEPILERGVYSRAGPDAQKIWRELIQHITGGYEFKDSDLLEEALESPGSGVTCVGVSHRHFENGNEELAKVGEKAMELILQDQFYIFKVPRGDADRIKEMLIGRKNLELVGTASKLEQFIRPKRPLRKSQKSNLFAIMKEDAKSEHPSRTIERGIKAIIGAAYFDGGYEGARRMMAALKLLLEV